MGFAEGMLFFYFTTSSSCPPSRRGVFCTQLPSSHDHAVAAPSRFELRWCGAEHKFFSRVRLVGSFGLSGEDMCDGAARPIRFRLFIMQQSCNMLTRLQVTLRRVPTSSRYDIMRLRLPLLWSPEGLGAVLTRRRRDARNAIL
jgi:hypothetical protein